METKPTAPIRRKPVSRFGDNFSPSRLEHPGEEDDPNLIPKLSEGSLEKGIPYDALPLNALDNAARHRNTLDETKTNLFFATAMGDASLIHDAYRSGMSLAPDPKIWRKDVVPGKHPIHNVTASRYGTNVLNGRRLRREYGFRPTTSAKGKTLFLDDNNTQLFDLPHSAGLKIVQNRDLGDGLSVMKAISNNASNAEIAKAFNAYYQRANFEKAPFDGWIMGEAPERLQVLQETRNILSNPEATPEAKLAARNLAAVAIFAELLPINRAKQMVLDVLPVTGNYRAGVAAVDDFSQAWDAAIKQGDYAKGGKHLLSFLVNAAGALTGVYGAGRALGKGAARLPGGSNVAARYVLGKAMLHGEVPYTSYSVEKLFGDEFRALPKHHQGLVSGAWNSIKGQVNEEHIRYRKRKMGLEPLHNGRRGRTIRRISRFPVRTLSGSSMT